MVGAVLLYFHSQSGKTQMIYKDTFFIAYPLDEWDLYSCQCACYKQKKAWLRLCHMYMTFSGKSLVHDLLHDFLFPASKCMMDSMNGGATDLLLSEFNPK